MPRNAHPLAGIGVVLAAPIVLLWPGSLLTLAIGAFGAGLLLLASVLLIARVARRPARR
jgi:hypothetical protein